MAPTRLIFCSTRADLSPRTVDVILGISQLNNIRDDITGALVVGEQYFTQLLEGNRASVSRRFARIMQDRRHEHVQIVSAAEVPHRLFPEQPMDRIEASAFVGTILDRYLISGAFQPHRLPQMAIEDLYRVLAEQSEAKAAAREVVGEGSEILLPLHQVHREAQQVLANGLGPRSRRHNELLVLRASIQDHLQEYGAMQQRLAESGGSAALQAELTELVAYLHEVLEEITERLGPARRRPSSIRRTDRSG